MNKYRNKKIVVDGVTFDSKREAHRWRDLQLLEAAGEITDLQRQVKFELIPAQYEIIDGKRKCVERKIVYYADFVYKDSTGRTVVEDVKSSTTKTKDYIIKRKLMYFLHGIRVKEVR